MSQKAQASDGGQFLSLLPPDLLESMKSVAKEEGKQLQSVFTEAVTLYLEQRRQPRPRAVVLDALDISIAARDELYRELAK